MKKWLRNFWYYHKIPIIIILAVLAAGIYLLSQRETTESDYNIAFISSRVSSDEQLGKVRTILEQAGEDQNGDNAVKVNIRVFRFAIGEDDQDPAEIAGLDSDLVGKVSGIFFMEDPKQFEISTNRIGKAADAVPVSSISRFSDCGIDDLYLIIRAGADQKYAALLSALTE